MSSGLHLIKLSVGSESVESMSRWQKQRLSKLGRLFHRTRMTPRRQDELLDGGSIYWIIKGQIRARQRLTGIEREVDENGRSYALLMLDPKLVRTIPTPHRPFQGWRYYDSADAPSDLGAAGEGVQDMPAEMLSELRGLGLL